MRKKWIAAALSTAVTMSMLAAGTIVPLAEETDAADDAWEMAYVLSVRDEFLRTLEDDVVESAKECGVGMVTLYAGSDSNQLISCVQAANTMGKDAVIINLNAAEDAQACIEAAGDMKVVFLNRVPADYSVLSENAAAVASDEHTSGRYQGEFLADYFKEKGQTDVNYVLLRGTGGLVHTELRSEGVIAAMEEAGLTPHEVAVIDADYNRNAAKDALLEALPSMGEYDCIISNNDAMAIGAILALQELGIDPSEKPIVGIDATDDGIEEMRNGNLAMTVFQSHKGQASASVQAAINMLEGKPLTEGTENEISEESPYVVYVPFVPVTMDNVDTFAE